MVMGIIYLLYSAYYLSDDIISRAGFVNVLLALVYFILGVTNFKCLCEKIKMVSAFLIQADDRIPVGFQ